MKYNMRLIILISLLPLLFLYGCGSINLKKNQSALISVIRAQEVDLVTINGTLLDSANTTAIVVAPGHNLLVFRWPKHAQDFTIPSTYQISALIEGGNEYIVTSDQPGRLPCVWRVDKTTHKPDFSRQIACSVRH